MKILKYKTNKLISKLLLISFFLSSQSCAVTVYNWQDIPDQKKIENLNENEKIQEYQKYAIKELKLTSSGHHIGFSNYLEPDVTYDLYTYSPIIYQYTPESEILFNTALMWENNQKVSNYLFQIFSVLYIFIGGGNIIGKYSSQSINSTIDSNSRKEFDQDAINFGLIGIASAIGYLGAYYFFYHKEMEQYELGVVPFGVWPENNV